MPKVVMTAGMMFTDADGRVLLVDQAYREDGIWSWPGGGAEANEPPAHAERREVAEELGLGVEPGVLLTVNWNHATDMPPMINFLFDGGTLSGGQIAAIVLDDELRVFAFFDPEEAAKLLSGPGKGELVAALIAKAHGSGVRLVDGRPRPVADAGGGR